MLHVCLLLSGAAALIYEVVWLREVTLVMGQTAYAVSALLAAFLGGLAVGAYLGGRRVARGGSSARLYAALELGVAVTALAAPFVLEALGPAFTALYRASAGAPVAHAFGQLLLCAAVLVVPAALMGATLPVVVGVVVPDRDPLARRAGALYAVNTFGGVLGAASAGLALLPALGAQATLLVAAGLNLAAAALALLDGRRAPPAEAAPAHAPLAPNPDGWVAPSRPLVLALYGLAGFAALTLQVGWARLVTLSLGSTIYGFTLVLVSFIAGIALGSALLSRLRVLRADPVRSLVALHAAIGIYAAVSLPWLGGLPGRVEALMRADLGFVALWLAELGWVAATILVPTLAMGAIFPLVAEVLRRGGADRGPAVGAAYAVNTGGSILGSLVAGFVLLPAIGMRGALWAAAGLSALVALGWALPSADARPGRLAAVGVPLGLALALAATVLPSWDASVAADAAFLTTYQSGGQFKDRTGATHEIDGPAGELVDVVEGPTTVAAVRELGVGYKMLHIGGVFEASSNSRNHRYLAHLGMLVHGEARRVLVIGLGAGNTLQAVLQHPVEHVDVVELSPEVVEVARRHFAETTGRPLDDPRVHLTVGDGRNLLRHGAGAYDVIISQPSHPWMSGAARLFTREFFAAARARLAEGGVMVAWFPRAAPDSLRSLLRTWLDVFEVGQLFNPFGDPQMFYVVGYETPRALDTSRIRRALEHPAGQAGAAEVGITGVGGVLAAVAPWPSKAELSEVPLNTDDGAFVELDAFRALIEGRPR